jgi:hypothetical protein
LLGFDEVRNLLHRPNVTLAKWSAEDLSNRFRRTIMEGSRMRTLLGAGLVLIGGLLLLRAIAAPIVLVGTPSPTAWEIERLAREEQRTQIELRRAELEVQRELDRAQLEARRELNEIRPGSNAPEILPPLPPVPALPPMPPMPPMPPTPPEPPFFHLGGWLNPTVALMVLLVLLLWQRGRRERETQQV